VTFVIGSTFKVSTKIIISYFSQSNIMHILHGTKMTLHQFP